MNWHRFIKTILLIYSWIMIIFIKSLALKTIQERSTWAGELSLKTRRHRNALTRACEPSLIQEDTSAVEHSGTPRGVAKRSQTLITNGVTCWVRPTRRWFFQAFNFDFSLGIRTVAILALCPRHNTVMWWAAALVTGLAAVHHYRQHQRVLRLTTWDTNKWN